MRQVSVSMNGKSRIASALGLSMKPESELCDDGQSTLAAYDRLKVYAAESLRAAVSTDDGEGGDIVSGRAILDGVGPEALVAALPPMVAVFSPGSGG